MAADGMLTLSANNKSFSVMVNPQDYSIKDAIKYSDYNEPRSKKFDRYEASVLTIPKIFLDTTGSIPVEKWPFNGSIDEMIKKLKSIVYDYNGKNHEPSVVDILWGDLKVQGRLLSMETKFALFDKDGHPIRAEVNLSFALFKTFKDLEAESNKSSPDLTHVIEVRAGDTLPNLCNKVYNDPSYYMQVARVNNLSDFCHLVPGTRLVFPPLVD
ncbi:peptidoglycan-binding protein [Fibrobacter sp.]|uniref:CIS tube protein n=1 Tax=Fibrobacter sp. TaxID=35828 RepID=UPI003867A49A